MLFWSIFIVFYAYIHILVATLWERSIQHFWAAQPPLFIEVLRSRTTWHFHSYALRTRHSTFRSAIAVSHYFCFWTACCQGIKDTFATFVIAVVDDVYNFLCVYRYFSHSMFWGSVRRFRNALRTKHSTFRSAITVSHYCCFWTACCQGIKDTYSQHLWMLFWSMFIIFYAYIDILVATIWERSIQHFWAAQPPLFIEAFFSLTTWHFQNSGRLFKWRVVTTWSDRHDPSRYLKLPLAVRLPAVNLTSFLNFTTRHPVSRAVNSKLTTRLSSFILDMCAHIQRLLVTQAILLGFGAVVFIRRDRALSRPSDKEIACCFYP